MKELAYIKKINGVLKEFYEVSHQDDIKMLEQFDKQIKTGKIKEIDEEENINKQKAIRNILPDLDNKYDLKNSKFFVHLFRNKKSNSNSSKKMMKFLRKLMKILKN